MSQADIRHELRDFRQATTTSFTAMREDMVDLRADMTDLRGEMSVLRGEMTDLRAHVDTGFAEVRGRLDGTAAGLSHITDLLTTLIDRRDGGAPTS